MSELFYTSTVLQDSPRLTAIKAADIQTHHAPHCENPWLAIPMKLAKEVVEASKDEPFDNIGDVTATHGVLLDDRGLLFYGDSQREVVDDALAFVARWNAKGGMA